MNMEDVKQLMKEVGWGFLGLLMLNIVFVLKKQNT
jgi:hypothetical protein